MPPALHFSLAALLVALGLPALGAEAPEPARSIERLFRGGDAALALKRADAALVERPGDASLRFLKGVILEETHREPEAIGIFEAMVQDFPDLPEPYNNLAVLVAAKGQLDRARELLEAALRADPRYATAQQNLGDVFLRLAQRAYESAGTKPADPRLERKLKLLRELATATR